MKFLNNKLFSGVSPICILLAQLGVFLSIFYFLGTLLSSFFYNQSSFLSFYADVIEMVIWLSSFAYITQISLFFCGAIYLVYGLYNMLVLIFNRGHAKYELIQVAGIVLCSSIIMIGATMAYGILWYRESLLSLIGWPYSF